MRRYHHTFKMELINKDVLRKEITKMVAEERAELDIDINSLWLAISEIKERLDCLNGRKLLTEEEKEIEEEIDDYLLEDVKVKCEACLEMFDENDLDMYGGINCCGECEERYRRVINLGEVPDDRKI